ncbi:glutathione S-transferase family protein [Oceanomicrobium pacificus]|uniref:Glutathione S-transferase n=1 Tax=Oceanomicrobium pacificus TaxID=2692916 RepID=A0A6B0TVS3_9RHOB|nr:glutathione S-transferase [Oceanomicrobium pacificus]MXU66799.1 glutathione S-transferase [Oceanomicrobium pacificus]
MTLPRPDLLVEAPYAPNPRRVRIFMAEKGIDLPREQVDIMAGEQFLAHAERVGTFHVPALHLDDGSWLTETVAICRYLEALHPEPNLMGRDAREAAEIEMWSRRMEFQLFYPVAQVLRHGNPKMAVMEDQVPQWAEANRTRVQSGLELLEHALSRDGYVAAGRYTIADITAFVAVEFMRTIRQELPEAHDATHVWRGLIRARPSSVP